MTRIIPIAVVPIAVALGLVLSVGCDSKTEGADKKAETKKVDAKDAKTGDAKPEPAAAAEPTAAPAAAPAAPLKELDLSAWGPEFAGWVAMAPEGAKVEFDDPSRQLVVSDVDFLSVGEAPGYTDMVKGLAGDKDNSNIQVVSETEARWERNPPLGKRWNFDIKLDVGGKPWSCAGGTFTDAPMADALVEMCKSMKKK